MSEAMLAAIASFAFFSAAGVAIVSGGNAGLGGNRNGDMEERNAYTTISLKKSGGGDDHKEESWQRGAGRRHHSDGQRQ